MSVFLTPCTPHQPCECPLCLHHQQTDTSPLSPGTIQECIPSEWSSQHCICLSHCVLCHTVPSVHYVPRVHSVPCAHTASCVHYATCAHTVVTPRNGKMSQRYADRTGSATPRLLTLEKGWVEGAWVTSCHTSQVTSADAEEKQLANALHAAMQV